MRRQGEQLVFLAWQDPVSRAWFPIGRLSVEHGGHYRFVYTQGFADVVAKGGLRPLIGFSDPTQVYESTELFPLFKNRIMSRGREEYATYLERLNLDEASAPLELLARSAGRRSTDSFEIFPYPLVYPTADAPRYHLEFFVHGLRHRTPEAIARAESLRPDDALTLFFDDDNPKDEHAVGLKSDDGCLLGFVPRYFGADLALLRAAGVRPEVEVVQVNLPPAPIQHRLLARLDAPWTPDAPPLSDRQYQPLAEV